MGPPLRKTFSETLGSEEKSEQAVQIYREYYDRVGQHKCSVYPGVVEMLETLKRSGVILGTGYLQGPAGSASHFKRAGAVPLF